MDPAIDADFYALEQLLDADGRQLIMRVRDFMEKYVAPVINHYWTGRSSRTIWCRASPGSASPAWPAPAMAAPAATACSTA